jgi:hypothetical protein
MAETPVIMQLPYQFLNADRNLSSPSGGANPYWIEWRVWMADHYEVPIALIVGYLLMVWIGQKIMADRKQGFNLSSVTVAWNLALSLFSAAGFYHVARAFVASGMQHGFLNQGGVLCRCLAPHSAPPLAPHSAADATCSTTITGWRCSA